MLTDSQVREAVRRANFEALGLSREAARHAAIETALDRAEQLLERARARMRAGCRLRKESVILWRRMGRVA